MRRESIQSFDRHDDLVEAEQITDVQVASQQGLGLGNVVG
jgi:hypothetical protein